MCSIVSGVLDNILWIAPRPKKVIKYQAVIVNTSILFSWSKIVRFFLMNQLVFEEFGRKTTEQQCLVLCLHNRINSINICKYWALRLLGSTLWTNSNLGSTEHLWIYIPEIASHAPRIRFGTHTPRKLCYKATQLVSLNSFYSVISSWLTELRQMVVKLILCQTQSWWVSDKMVN